MLSNKIHKTYNFQIQPAKCLYATVYATGSAGATYPLSGANASETDEPQQVQFNRSNRYFITATGAFIRADTQ